MRKAEKRVRRAGRRRERRKKVNEIERENDLERECLRDCAYVDGANVCFWRMTRKAIDVPVLLLPCRPAYDPTNINSP